MNWEIFGVLAGAVVLSGFLPQIVKGYKTKKLKDLSYLLNGLIGVGMFMWILYGLHIGSFSVIVTNIFGVSFNIILIVMKYLYEK